MIDPVNRFTVYKNAHDYLSSGQEMYPEKAIFGKEAFEIDFQGDGDFKKYFRGNFQRFEEIFNSYQRPDLFLQNIYWESIFENVEKSLIDIFEKILEEKAEAQLILINAHPLEMVIMGEILRSLGYKNIVHNFNRNLSVNTPSKTFEAYMLYGIWKNSFYFQEYSKGLLERFSPFSCNFQQEKFYFLFDENNSFIPYEYRNIDNYIKTQIGYKEPKNVYRLDKYPQIEFLLQKGIKKVIAFDNDGDFTGALDAYEQLIHQSESDIAFLRERYDFSFPKNPGLYEDYLVLKNKEYAKYRKEIEHKVLNNFPATHEDKVSNNESKFSFPSHGNYKNISPSREVYSNTQDKSMIPYIVFFPVIFIAFILSDFGSSRSTGTSGNGLNSHYFGGNTWSNGGNGSSISSSQKKSSSQVQSFGGGGFNKGGG